MMKKKDAIRKSITLENNYKNTIKKYVISVGIAIGMVFLTLWFQEFWKQTELVVKYKILSDAFTVPGLVFILVGCLVFLTNEGSLTALGYMLKRLGKMLNPFSNKDMERYADYVESRKKVTGYSFLFYTGLFFSVIAAVFIILFYSVYSA